MQPSDRTMFEIYREEGYERQYRVVYFTELEEHNKEQEINRALAGEHLYDGFLLDTEKDAAKKKINDLLTRLNEGAPLTPDDIERELTAINALA